MKWLFNTEGIIYKAMTAVYQMIILNLLWCITSIPLVTVGASTTALYYVIGKIVRKEEVHEIKDFYKSFRENFKQATCIWMILCAAYVMIYTNFSFLENYGSMGGLMLAVQLPVLVQVVIITVFVFPLLSRYESSTMGIIKASWVLGIKHVFSCFGILAIIAAAALIARTVPGLFLLVFISFTAFAIYLVVGRIMEKYRPGAV